MVLETKYLNILVQFGDAFPTPGPTLYHIMVGVLACFFPWSVSPCVMFIPDVTRYLAISKDLL